MRTPLRGCCPARTLNACCIGSSGATGGVLRRSSQRVQLSGECHAQTADQLAASQTSSQQAASFIQLSASFTRVRQGALWDFSESLNCKQ